MSNYSESNEVAREKRVHELWKKGTYAGFMIILKIRNGDYQAWDMSQYIEDGGDMRELWDYRVERWSDFPFSKYYKMADCEQDKELANAFRDVSKAWKVPA